MSGPTVLVVDDVDDIRLLVGHVLRRAGYAVREAAGGAAALDLLARDDPPAVIVLDVQMPDVDGWQVLGAVRASPWSAEVPVVMCTVKARPSEAARAWVLGCDAYLPKPFSIHELLGVVDAVVARTPAQRAEARAAGLAAARSAEGVCAEVRSVHLG